MMANLEVPVSLSTTGLACVNIVPLFCIGIPSFVQVIDDIIPPVVMHAN